MRLIMVEGLDPENGGKRLVESESGPRADPPSREKRAGRALIWVISALAAIIIGIVVWRSSTKGNGEASADALAQSYLKRQSTKPHMIDGILTTTLDQSVASAPLSITFCLNDKHYGIQAIPAKDSQPLYEATAQQKLETILTVIADAAGKDAHFANSTGFWLKYLGPGPVKGSIAIPARPASREDPAGFKSRREAAIVKIATSLISRYKAENRNLLMGRYYGITPPGFGLSVGLNENLEGGRSEIPMLPISEDAIKQALITCIGQRLASQGASSSLAGSMPPVTTIRIYGPASTIEFEVPTATGPKYPTVADVELAANSLVRQKAGEAAKQINALNDRASKQ